MIPAGIFENGNDDGDQEGLHNGQDSVDGTGVPQDKGADAEGGAEEEDETNHFFSVAENSKKAVMDMIGAHVIDPILEAFHLAGDDAL